MTPLPQAIQEEIGKHDLSTFKALGLNHAGVTMAVAFLLANGMEEMGRHLREMAQGGFLCQGPLDGFVAAAVQMKGGEHIVLSSLYPEYNTNEEIMASLVQEAGFLEQFSRAALENELRGQQALAWIARQKPAPVSFIASAAHKNKT